MNGTLPANILIAAQILKQSAIGDSIEARFKAIIAPRTLRDACWMCSTEDEQFRSAVGGLMLSYETDSPEQQRIGTEMLQLNRLTTLLQAAAQGMGIGEFPEPPEGFVPIGLMNLWRERERS